MLLRYCFQVYHNGYESIWGLSRIRFGWAWLWLCVGSDFRAIVNRNCWELSLHTKVLHLQGKYPQCNQGCTQQTLNQISRYRDICICYSLHSSTEYRHNAVKVRLIQHPHCRGSPNNPRCDLPEFRSSSNMLLSQRSLPDVLQIVGQAVRINLNCVQLRNIRTYLNKICIKIYHKQSNENRGRM